MQRLRVVFPIVGHMNLRTKPEFRLRPVFEDVDVNGLRRFSSVGVEEESESLIAKDNRHGCTIQNPMQPYRNQQFVRLYITSGDSIPSQASMVINSRRATAAVASRTVFRDASSSVRM